MAKAKNQKKIPSHEMAAAMRLGPRVLDDGIEFGIYAPKATSAWIAFFDSAIDTTPSAEHALSLDSDCTDGVWTKLIPGLEPNALFAWRFSGPGFDESHYVLDPYAPAVAFNRSTPFPKGIATATEDYAATRPKNDGPPIIYEMHVRGFTQSDSSGIDNRGTYQSVIEKIPYLKSLGITAVELLPVHACGELDLPRTNPDTGETLTNYWGYNPLTFMAPDPRYAEGDGAAAIGEFRAMADALHAAGIELIVDVVYNHTAEMGADGPLQSLRGIDPETYYHIDEDGKYVDVTGCGNSVRTAHPVTARLVVDSLRHWHKALGVDGFRFDLASVLNRDEAGHLHTCSELVERIAEDPELKDVHLIAEAWDVGGAYQVGDFGTPRWRTWNDRFRDDVRKFWRGDPGMKEAIASRIGGSADIYGGAGRSPHNCVNFVSSHDGFTLRDVVSYNHKHNKANGEKNKDGHNHEPSWNCGTEGATDNEEIEHMRDRMQRSMLATVLLSMGVPMICAGDECGRTQQGNNNAYCQDNDLSWFDWSLPEKHESMVEMVRRLIAFRKNHPLYKCDSYATNHDAVLCFDFAGEPLHWESEDDAMGCRLSGDVFGGRSIYFMLNPTLLAREFYVPEGTWAVHLDTAVPPYFFDTPIPITQKKPYIVGRKTIAMAIDNG